jgi:hypothetical protein
MHGLKLSFIAPAVSLDMERRLLAAGMLLFAAASANATTPSCEPTLFPQDLSAVASAEVNIDRLPLLRDSESCSRPQGLCPTKSYLVRGDRLIAAQRLDGFRCVAFAGSRGQTTGWVRDDALKPVDVDAATDWAGTWVRKIGHSTLTITASGSQYLIVAEATAQAADPDNVRTGGLEGPLRVTGAQASVTTTDADGTCALHLRKLGSLIVANDGASDDANSSCGGMGVTMNGVYARQHR